MTDKKEVAASVADYIEKNMGRELGLDEIASYAGYSKFYLNRMFGGETGMSIYQYIKSRRLTEAARRLLDPAASISQVAMDAGYDSQQAFTQAFKQAYGTTPFAYQKIGIFSPVQERLKLKEMWRCAA